MLHTVCSKSFCPPQVNNPQIKYVRPLVSGSFFYLFISEVIWHAFELGQLLQCFKSRHRGLSFTAN